MNATRVNRRVTRTRLIFRRWYAIGATALFSFVITFIIGRLQREFLEKLADVPGWFIVIAIAGALAVLVSLSPRRFVATLGLRHPLVFPPHWFGIAFGIAVALGLISQTDLFAEDFELSASADDAITRVALLLGVSPMALSILAYSIRRIFSSSASSGRKWDDPQQLTLERVQAWLRDDDPVIAPSGDLFGHSAIARRMAQRLAKETSSQALVGRLGSGKSTVRSLVESWLSDQKTNIEVVHVELWPYDSPRAAVEGILTSVVEAISHEVSTSQLEGVPAAYGEAIAKVSGIADRVPVFARKQTPPAETLRKLDDVATIIQRRYVLWVEDLERFAAGDPNAAAAESELERLAPIRAVLHGLDQLRSMTVVTATTDLFRRFDMEKIARYVESIPELKFRDARRIISRIRLQLLQSSNVLDPAPVSARSRLGWDDPTEPRDEALEAAFLGDSLTTFASAVSSLASTPRILKQGLRRALETWEVLKGEIDLDDLLALSILRESHPGVFALLERHSFALRSRRRGGRNDSSPMDVFIEALGRLLEGEKRTYEAVRLIAHELFDDQASRRPQGVSHSNHADYWHRFLAVPSLSTADRDQEVLATIRKNEVDSIVDLLVSDRSAALEDFGHLISPRRLEQLLVPLTCRVVDDDVTTWAGHHPPGLVPLWRMLRKANRYEHENAVLVAEIERALETAAPRNLLLLFQLSYWMAAHSPEVTDLLPAAQRQRINDRTRDLFVNTYTGRPEELATRLQGVPPDLVLWLCWSIERVRARSTSGVPFSGWAQFAETLLNALPFDAASVAPQIASLLVRQRRRLRAPDDWVLDEAQGQALFGDVSKVVEAVRKATEGKEVDARVRVVIERITTNEVASDSDNDTDEEYWCDASEDPDDADAAVNDDPRRVDDHATRAPRVLDETESAMDSVVRDAGSSAADDSLPGALPGQVEGYWYIQPEDIPTIRPVSNASAILPEKTPLADGSLCLYLVETQGKWSPLSEGGIEVNTRASALLEGQTLYFVVAGNWPRTYQVRFDGLIELDELSRRFGELARKRAQADRLTVVLEVTPCIVDQQGPSPTSAAPTPIESVEAVANTASSEQNHGPSDPVPS